MVEFLERHDNRHKRSDTNGETVTVLILGEYNIYSLYHDSRAI